jgi:NitT/TauT family transport system ATP-binding protein
MTACVAYSHGVPLVQLRGVSLALGGCPILRSVEAEIRDLRVPGRVAGQIVALLGPSGIGKTRLFRILAGLDAPDSGSVLIGENARPVSRGHVGVVAQHYPLFAHRTVLDNLVVAGAQADLGARLSRERARGFLARFGMEAQASLYPAQLSGGQRQRVAIAQQFMCSEHVLLMDEPFSGLDPLAVDSVCALISELTNLDELNTTIVVTHDIGAAIQVADTLWLMGRDRDDRGRMIPGARIQAVYDVIDRGVAFREGVTRTPEYADLLREVLARFPML